MQHSTLFPSEHEPPVPDVNRPEPTFWLKRMALLREPDTKESSIIRELEFKRGLNVVQTRQMNSTGGPPIGHSVGKTLMMRLIRYTLGETCFGTEDTRSRVAAAMPLGHVVAHWRVDGDDWIVVRSFTDPEVSFAAKADNWRDVIDDQERLASHRSFIDAVSEASLSALPKFTLPRGRVVKWTEVLAWLARDYQCGYRKANDWRDADAGSKPTLDLVENALVMQWLMGLMPEVEIDLRLKHRGLLDDLGKKKRTREMLERRRDEALPAIQKRLGAEGFIGAGEQNVIGVVDPVKFVADKIESLEKLKVDRIEAAKVGELETEVDNLRGQLNALDAEMKGCNSSIKFLKEQIKKYEQDPLAAYRRCQQSGGCWMQSKAAGNAADPAADSHLSDFKEQLEQQKAERQDAVDLSKNHLQSFKGAEAALAAERKRLSAELSGIDESIGLWKGKIDDAAEFGTVDSAAEQAIKSFMAADELRELSLKDQADIRVRKAGAAAELSNVYEYLLQQVFGPEGAGAIQVDGKGLSPAPDPKLSPSGAAISVMTCVLCFDIACVAASLSGIGQHPRFLMHDSPREGEMQGELFNRLFEIVVELTELFETPAQANFQYIVTTTSELSPELVASDGVNVVETLHRQDEDGLLLEARF